MLDKMIQNGQSEYHTKTVQFIIGRMDNTDDPADEVESESDREVEMEYD